MATQKDIEATYDYMDEIFRLSLGNHADITGAMYNGDFSLTLEEAQKAKHEYILAGIHFKKGDRVLILVVVGDPCWRLLGTTVVMA